MDDDFSCSLDKIREFMGRLPYPSIDYIGLEDEEEIAGLNHQKFKFYEPKIVYFGLRSGKERTRKMEKKKLVYGSQLHLREREKNSYNVHGYKIRAQIDYFLRCNKYSDKSLPGYPNLGIDSIFLDACFIVELILKYANRSLIEENDPIFVRGQILQTTIRDMFVLTNQLPFKVLKELFDITTSENSLVDSVGLIMEQELCLGPIYVDGNHNYEDVNVKHLVAFVRDIWVHSSELGSAGRVEVNRRNGRQQVIGNASELQRAGIRFKGVHKPTFDLNFNSGMLEIPVLSITEETECFFQNVVAYEQLSRGDKMAVVSDYCVFMDCLIQSPQDVQLLRECGVINSYLHDDKDVVELFDNVGKRTPSSTYFSYSDLFDDVNKHCVGKWNSWKANFRRNYFKDDNHLEVITFMFAIYIILPVTVLQTVYTILSYYKG